LAEKHNPPIGRGTAGETANEWATEKSAGSAKVIA
jgi:hypothetical protein